MAREIFNRTWRVLVVSSLILSVFGIYLTYSQNAYLISVLEGKVPLSTPQTFSQTSVVLNPFTGNFVAVSSVSMIYGIIIVLIFAAFVIYKKK